MKELNLKARVEYLDKVLGFVDEILESADCPVKQQVQIDVAVEEIYVNIAHYAYAPGEGDALIQAELLSDPKGIRVTFIDSGMPYNPLEKEDPDVTLSVEERKIGGLGIFMVKKSMDEVAYEYKDGKNHFTLCKYFG